MKTKFFFVLFLLLLIIKCQNENGGSENNENNEDNGGSGDSGNNGGSGDSGNNGDNEENEGFENDCSDHDSPKNEEECFNIYNKTIQDLGYRCCYYEYKLENKPEGDENPQEGTKCGGVDKDELEKLDELVTSLNNEAKEDGNGFVKFDIICDSEHKSSLNASILKIGLVIFILALLF